MVLALLSLAGWPAPDDAEAQALAAPAVQAPALDAGCIVTPLRRRELRELANAPLGSARTGQDEPGLSPDTAVQSAAAGAPVEAKIVRAVEATARHLTACYNAGDLRRLLALYSHDYLLAVWGGLAGPNPAPEQVDQAIAFISRPVPLPPEDRIQMVSVAEVWRLPAGRVAAVVTFDETRLLLVFVVEDGEYRVDAATDLTDAGGTEP